METTNYDKFIKASGLEKKTKGKSKYGFEQPFRLLVVGQPASGKTNAVFDLIFKHQKFDHIVYVAKDITESKLTMLDQALNYDKNGEEVEDPPLELMTDEEFMGVGEDAEPYDMDSLDKEEQNLIVFDDAISFSKSAQDKITDFFIRGRKKGISCIYIGHRYHEIPKKIRANFTGAFFFRVPTARERNMICSDLAQFFSKDFIKEALIEATQLPYDFLRVDMTVNPHTELYKHLHIGMFHPLIKFED